MSSFRDKVTADISTSPLWIESIRDEVTSTKLTDFKVHELKSQTLVPGKSCHNFRKIMSIFLLGCYVTQTL